MAHFPSMTPLASWVPPGSPLFCDGSWVASTAKRIFLYILYFQRLKIRFEIVATNCSKWSPSWSVWRRFGSVLYVLFVFFWSYVDTAISAPLSTDNQIISILWIHARHFCYSFRGLESRGSFYRLFYRCLVALSHHWLPKRNPQLRCFFVFF